VRAVVLSSGVALFTSSNNLGLLSIFS